MHVLGNAHAPEDHRSVGPRIGTGHVANGLWFNAAERAHHLRRHIRNIGCQCLETFGMSINVGLVKKCLINDHIEHGVE